MRKVLIGLALVAMLGVVGCAGVDGPGKISLLNNDGQVIRTWDADLDNAWAADSGFLYFKDSSGQQWAIKGNTIVEDTSK